MTTRTRIWSSNNRPAYTHWSGALGDPWLELFMAVVHLALHDRSAPIDWLREDACQFLDPHAATGSAQAFAELLGVPDLLASVADRSLPPVRLSIPNLPEKEAGS